MGKGQTKALKKSRDDWEISYTIQAGAFSDIKRKEFWALAITAVCSDAEGHHQQTNEQQMLPFPYSFCCWPSASSYSSLPSISYKKVKTETANIAPKYSLCIWKNIFKRKHYQRMGWLVFLKQDTSCLSNTCTLGNCRHLWEVFEVDLPSNDHFNIVKEEN